ncbi:hypothetical protein HQ560_17840 [bacterium]|nr:hypothetical protein [bacterium]
MRIAKDSARSLALAGVGVAVGTAEIALLHRQPALLSAVLLVTAGAIIVLRGHRALAVYVVGAIIGPAAETFGIRAGAWAYAQPAFLGIPLWLPFAWGLAAVLVVWVADTITGLTCR